MNFRLTQVTATAVLIGGAVLGAQDRPVDKAFAQYDRIAQALVKDSVEGIQEAAATLQPLAVELAGESATAPAAQLASAKNHRGHPHRVCRSLGSSGTKVP